MFFYWKYLSTVFKKLWWINPWWNMSYVSFSFFKMSFLKMWSIVSKIENQFFNILYLYFPGKNVFNIILLYLYIHYYNYIYIIIIYIYTLFWNILYNMGYIFRSNRFFKWNYIIIRKKNIFNIFNFYNIFNFFWYLISNVVCIKKFWCISVNMFFFVETFWGPQRIFES